MLNERKRNLTIAIKKQLNCCYEYCNKMDKNGLSEILDRSMKEQCENDIIITSLFFSMADDVVREEEAEILNCLFDANLTAFQYKSIYEDAKVNRESFVNRRILTFEIAKMLDDTLKTNHVVVKMFIELFINVAKAIAVVDGDVDKDEISSIAAFQANLERKYL